MMTSKDQENLWDKHKSQRAAENNTQIDENRLSHLYKNPMKENKFQENFLMKKKVIAMIIPKLLTIMMKTKNPKRYNF